MNVTLSSVAADVNRCVGRVTALRMEFDHPTAAMLWPAGIVGRELVQRQLSQNGYYPPSSQPYDSPKMRTTNLVNGVIPVMSHEGSSLSVVVGSYAQNEGHYYAGDVENGHETKNGGWVEPRPYLRPVVNNYSNVIRDSFVESARNIIKMFVR